MFDPSVLTPPRKYTLEQYIEDEKIRKRKEYLEQFNRGREKDSVLLNGKKINPKKEVFA